MESQYVTRRTIIACYTRDVDELRKVLHAFEVDLELKLYSISDSDLKAIKKCVKIF